MVKNSQARPHQTSLAIQIGMSLTLVQGTVPISSSTPQSNASVQKSQDTSKDQDQSTPVHKPKSQKKRKRGSLVIVPIPISSPAIGSGLNLIVGYVFKLDSEDSSSPPSQFGLAAIARTTESEGLH